MAETTQPVTNYSRRAMNSFVFKVLKLSGIPFKTVGHEISPEGMQWMVQLRRDPLLPDDLSLLLVTYHLKDQIVTLQKEDESAPTAVQASTIEHIAVNNIKPEKLL